MRRLIHDIKILLSGPPEDIPRMVAYVTPESEKQHVEHTLQELEHRIHTLEQLKKELHPAWQKH
jgi:hypothetical protein